MYSPVVGASLPPDPPADTPTRRTSANPGRPRRDRGRPPTYPPQAPLLGHHPHWFCYILLPVCLLGATFDPSMNHNRRFAIHSVRCSSGQHCLAHTYRDSNFTIKNLLLNTFFFVIHLSPSIYSTVDQSLTLHLHWGVLGRVLY